jgi:hypothetical protein
MSRPVKQSVENREMPACVSGRSSGLGVEVFVAVGVEVTVGEGVKVTVGLSIVSAGLTSG